LIAQVNDRFFRALPKNIEQQPNFFKLLD
jgi:hypothetical protein